MKRQYYLTKSGVQELESELQGLLAERGPIADRIRTAREFGDLAENAEYSSARQEQERLESRIGEIEHILQNVQVISKPSGGTKVQLGSVVSLKNGGGQAKQFQVVGTVEADPLNGKISDESPIGQALMGQKVGNAVEIKTPAEIQTYKIVKIA